MDLYFSGTTGNKKYLLIYRSAVVGMVLFESAAKISIVWDLADLLMGMTVIINLVAILELGKFAFAALEDYLEQKKSGKDPVFIASRIPGLKHADCWQKEEEARRKDKLA